MIIERNRSKEENQKIKTKIMEIEFRIHDHSDERTIMKEERKELRSESEKRYGKSNL